MQNDRLSACLFNLSVLQKVSFDVQYFTGFILYYISHYIYFNSNAYLSQYCFKQSNPRVSSKQCLCKPSSYQGTQFSQITEVKSTNELQNMLMSCLLWEVYFPSVQNNCFLKAVSLCSCCHMDLIFAASALHLHTWSGCVFVIDVHKSQGRLWKYSL